MAKKTITTTEYTDDLDGTAAVGTVSFAFEGTSYEIDLSKSNAKAFEKAMAPYVGHARKVRATRRAGGRRQPTTGRDLAAVRDWASQNGYEVSARGRVASSVLEAYDAAN